MRKMLFMCLLFLATFLIEVVPKATQNFETAYPKTCVEIQNRGTKVTGVYTIKPEFSSVPFSVFCNMDVDEGGWIYILNRIDGSQNFSLLWEDYKNGFGNVSAEHWLGLDHIHELTGYQDTELLVELIDWNLDKYYIHYTSFSVAGQEDDYRLQTLKGYSGDLGNSLLYHLGQKFSTVDVNNDIRNISDWITCAQEYGGGGWWYKSCFLCALTGQYQTRTDSILGARPIGISWTSVYYIGKESHYGFKEARMMIKPIS